MQKEVRGLGPSDALLRPGYSYKTLNQIEDERPGGLDDFRTGSA